MALAVFAFALVMSLATLGWNLLPRTRRRVAERAAEKVAKAAQVDPGPDWPVLYRRLRARGMGASVGTAAASLPLGPALLPLLGECSRRRQG